MKITPHNWNIVRRTLLEIGIDHVERDADGTVRVIVTNDEQRFEVSKESLEELKLAGIVKRGIKIDDIP